MRESFDPRLFPGHPSCRVIPLATVSFMASRKEGWMAELAVANRMRERVCQPVLKEKAVKILVWLRHGSIVS